MAQLTGYIHCYPSILQEPDECLVSVLGFSWFGNEPEEIIEGDGKRISLTVLYAVPYLRVIRIEGNQIHKPFLFWFPKLLTWLLYSPDLAGRVGILYEIPLNTFHQVIVDVGREPDFDG